MKRTPLSRVALEGLVIVISILLAFGIEAWWSDAQERDEETRILAAVLQDARANLAILEENRAYHEAALSTERRLLRLVESTPEPLSIAQADTLIADLTWWRGSDHWQTGGLDVLVSGGRLDLVRDEALRLALASWSRNLANVRYAEDQENEFFDGFLMPFLRANARVTQIAEIAQSVPGTGELVPYGQVDFNPRPQDHRELLYSQGFQNIVLQKVWIQTDVLASYDDFEDELLALINLLEAELAPG